MIKFPLTKNAIGSKPKVDAEEQLIDQLLEVREVSLASDAARGMSKDDLVNKASDLATRGVTVTLGARDEWYLKRVGKHWMVGMPGYDPVLYNHPLFAAIFLIDSWIKGKPHLR